MNCPTAIYIWPAILGLSKTNDMEFEGEHIGGTLSGVENEMDVDIIQISLYICLKFSRIKKNHNN